MSEDSIMLFFNNKQSIHYAITAEFDGERILKIGQYLSKLWARI